MIFRSCPIKTLVPGEHPEELSKFVHRLSESLRLFCEPQTMLEASATRVKPPP